MYIKKRREVKRRKFNERQVRKEMGGSRVTRCISRMECTEREGSNNFKASDNDDFEKNLKLKLPLS